MGQKTGDAKWYELSQKVEEYVKREKGLYCNVDFYSASLYHVMGIPTDLFTPVFAVSRVAGWTANTLQQLAESLVRQPRSPEAGTRNSRSTRGSNSATVIHSIGPSSRSIMSSSDHEVAKIAMLGLRISTSALKSPD